MKKNIAIIGGGPSALFLALFLNTDKFNITIYDKNKTLGKKLMLAGKGGFNLSHSEDIESMINRYLPSSFLRNALLNFTNKDLRIYLKSLGIETYIGTSGRIYPTEDIKPSQVLKTIVNTLKEKGIIINTQNELTNWNAENKLEFNHENEITADYIIFALGGSSWRKTGSDGLWTRFFEDKNIKCIDFESSNCSVNVKWDKTFIENNEGLPFKNISVKCNGKTKKGEILINKTGIEGNAIYPLANEIRKQINLNNKAIVHIDLKPMLSEQEIIIKLKSSKYNKTADILRKDIKISKQQVNLLRSYLNKTEFTDKKILAGKIKSFAIEVNSLGEIDKAISTVGGIDINELNNKFELRKIKNIFCIGEMIDWDAPTGGYLLQACFSMGVFLAKHLNES